ncbi:MAG TPA: FkbM family methyltransferase [Cyclobacteriaceae bacterium]|jgi:FkbM family methyltransferase
MVRKQINRLLRGLGFEIRRYDIGGSSIALLRKCLDFYDIDMVIDVGANVGQYSMALLDTGFERKILSFEPIAKVYRQLENNSRRFANWEVCNLGVGDKEGTLTINISENYESSSLLPVTELSISAEPKSGYVSKEEIRVVTLDSFLVDRIKTAQNPYLKIDVQGYELQVLEGAKMLLPKIKGIQLEMSFVKLYEGGPLYKDIFGYLENAGFQLYTIIPDFRDERSGRMLQADGIFIREPE